jgi:hypothetical protein
MRSRERRQKEQNYNAMERKHPNADGEDAL